VTQRHGADVYDAAGKALPWLDFSTTVVELERPKGWQKAAQGRLDALTRYPVPYARGLEGELTRRLKLKAGSVLVSNGSSEALDWLAREAAGHTVCLPQPCFGEYEPKLKRAGARLRKLPLTVPCELEPAFWLKGLKAGDQLWLANPSSPLGWNLDVQILPVWRQARRQGVLLVLDEALRVQALEKQADMAGKPGVVVLRSLGKGLGLPGLRLGYAAGAPATMKKLKAWMDPWAVNGLAQAMGAWVFDEEKRGAGKRRDELDRRREDLFRQLAPLAGKIKVILSDVGFILVESARPAAAMAAALQAKGLLVRDCSSFGLKRTLRLNPRGPADNARLAKALKGLL
jgi:histidinol-phosphate/aromatic aminotransferase/cobyric acid decarboxylase-like protein